MQAGSYFTHHYVEEYGLGDPAFIGSAHFLTSSKQSGAAKESDELFEMRLRRVRNRIEHLFARFDCHRWLWGCDILCSERLSSLFSLLFAAEMLDWRLKNRDPYSLLAQ